MKKAGRDNPEPAFKWYEPVLKIDLTNGGTFTSIRLYIHFLTKGTAAFVTSGPDFDVMKAKFAWARAAMAVAVASLTRTLLFAEGFQLT